MVVEWDLVCEAEGWHATIGAAQGSKAITLFQRLDEWYKEVS